MRSIPRLSSCNVETLSMEQALRLSLYLLPATRTWEERRGRGSYCSPMPCFESRNWHGIKVKEDSLPEEEEFF